MKSTYRFCKETGRVVNAAEIEASAPEPKYDPSASYDEYLNGPRAGTFMKCQVCGELHELSHWPHNHMPEQLDLAHEYAGIGIISDNLESIGGINGIQSMADGRMYTSKSRLRAEYRARGLTEMGNDKAPERKKPKPDRKAIRDAVRRATWQVEHEGATVSNFRKRAKRAPSAFGPVAK